MILAAGAAIVMVSALVFATSRHTRRPPLRTGREEDLEATGADRLIDLPPRRRVSPIDRSMPIHDLDPIEGRMMRGKPIEDRSGAGSQADDSIGNAKGAGQEEEADWWEIEQDEEAARSADRTGRERR